MDSDTAGGVLRDLFKTSLAHIPWQAFREGVEMHPLSQAADGMSSALLRYAPGARVPRHRHVGYEHIVVLQGTQCDERGEYAAGSIVINAPGSQHTVWSVHGCVVFVVWEQPVAFVTETATS